MNNHLKDHGGFLPNDLMVNEAKIQLLSSHLLVNLKFLWVLIDYNFNESLEWLIKYGFLLSHLQLYFHFWLLPKTQIWLNDFHCFYLDHLLILRFLHHFFQKNMRFDQTQTKICSQSLWKINRLLSIRKWHIHYKEYCSLFPFMLVKKPGQQSHCKT